MRGGKVRVTEDSPISTSTSFAKIRGFTVELLYHLKGHKLRVIDLVELTGRYSGYVQRYLYNMRNYGLAEKEGSYWKLTPLGISFLSYLNNIKYKNMIKRKNKEGIKKNQRKNKESYSSKTVKQVFLYPWLRRSSLDGTEKEVVEVLVNHYNRTGSKFILVRDIYELAERCEVNPSLLEPALKRLKEDNIIYIYKRKGEAYAKVGLKKAFIETLQKLRS